MKKKKQMKIILAMVVVIAILLGGWVMMKSSGLSAEEIQKPQEDVTGENDIPEPPNPNAINVQDNFTFLKDAQMVGGWSNTVRIFPKIPGSIGALWYNEKISLKKDFEGDFAVYFGDNNQRAYDGITLTFQNSPRGKEAIGGPGAKFGNNASYIVFPSTGEINPSEPGIARGVSIAITPGIKSNILPGHQGTPTVSVAVPKAELAPNDDVYSLLYWPESYGKDRSCSNYNIQPLNSGWLNNGEWLKISFKWDAKLQKLSYRLGQFLDDDQSQIPSVFDFSNPGWQSFQFQTGATSLTSNYLPTDNSTGSNITEFVGKTAEEYFGGDEIYWGFAGSNVSSGYFESVNGEWIPPEEFAINPVVSIGKTPNQSQSPLQLSMTKLGEIGSDGKRQPLAGAKFILQAQGADGRWQQFNPEKATKNVAEVFTTGADGKIVIKATDNQKHANLIDLVLQYGGTYNGEPATEEHPSNYAAFRFREVKAAAPNPDGDAYIAPPAIDPKDPTNYAASEPANSAALFTTKSVKLSGSSTTPTDPTTENPDDGDFGTVYNSNQPWLPYYKPGLGIGGGGWLDSMESYIPRSNAFVMQYLPGKTKVVDWSENIAPKDTPVEDLPKGKIYNTSNQLVGENEHSIFLPLEENKETFVTFANVGYFNGEFIGVKVILTPTTKVSDIDINESKSSYIITQPNTDSLNREMNFLRIEAQTTTSPVIKYELVDSKGNTIKEPIGWYFTNDNVSDVKNIYIPLDSFLNIYSIPLSAEIDSTIRIKYDIDDNWLKMIGVPPLHNLKNKTYTVTSRNSELEIKLFSDRWDLPGSSAANETMGIGYSSDSLVKVEFPDPEVTKTDYTEIIGDGKGVVGSGEDAEIEDFSFQFVQQVPWESAEQKNNRTQFPTWNVNASVSEEAPVGPSTEEVQGEEPKEKPWTVTALDDPYDPTNNTGLKADELFAFSGDKITPKGSLVTDAEGKTTIDSEVIDGNDFYNHYYSFQKEVSINYDNPVSPGALEEREKSEEAIAKPFGYFDFSGSVKLDVVDVDATPEQKAGMNKGRDKVDVSYHTQMNFLADKVNYKYVDKAKYDEELDGIDNPTEKQKADAIEEATIPIANLPAALKEKDEDNKDVLKTGQAIVTWQVPLTPTTYTEANIATNPGSSQTDIDGYEYVGAELNGQTNLQVKVTKLLNNDVTEDDVTEGKVTADDYDKDNEVVLFYRQNAMTLTTSGDIYFKQTEVPLGASKAIIPRATSIGEAGGAVTSSTGESTESSTEESTSSTSDAGFTNEKNGTDWSITVSGGLPSEKTGYSVSATLKEPFNNGDQGGSLSDILVFKKDGEAATNGTTIPLTTDTVGENKTASPVELFKVNPANNPVPYTFTKKWGATEGFLLDLSYTKSLDVWFNMTSDSSGKKKPTVYKGEIELSLNYLP